MENNESKNGRAVMSTLNGLHLACSPSNAESPALEHPEGAPTVGLADSTIKRYYLMREARRKTLLAAVERDLVSRLVAQKFFTIASDIFELEVWLRHPELIGKTVAVYDDWSIGPVNFEAETGDLFKPVGLKEIMTMAKAGDSLSTTSGDVKVGGFATTL